MTSVSDRADRGFAPVQSAIESGRIPGAVLGVIDLASGARAIRHAGSAQIMPERVAMRAETVFDLASLTKPVFTAIQILRLVEAGRIGLDDTLANVIPDLRQYDVSGAWERRLTFRQCLAHQTPLPAVWPIYTYGDDPARLRAFVLNRGPRQRRFRFRLPLSVPAGESDVYIIAVPSKNFNTKVPPHILDHYRPLDFQLVCCNSKKH